MNRSFALVDAPAFVGNAATAATYRSTPSITKATSGRHLVALCCLCLVAGNASANPPPCDPANPLKVSASDAFKLASAYGKRRQDAEAACWGLISAQQGNSQAQYYQAEALFRGTGVPRNPQEGMYWLEKSANQNFYDAQAMASQLYENGIWGVEKNPEKAAYWARRANASAGQLAGFAGAIAGVGAAAIAGEMNKDPDCADVPRTAAEERERQDRLAQKNLNCGR